MNGKFGNGARFTNISEEAAIVRADPDSAVAAFVKTVIPVKKKNIDGRKECLILLMARGARNTSPTPIESSVKVPISEPRKLGLSVNPAVKKIQLQVSW